MHDTRRSNGTVLIFQHIDIYGKMLNDSVKWTFSDVLDAIVFTIGMPLQPRVFPSLSQLINIAEGGRETSL